jgi:hypothetical protein
MRQRMSGRRNSRFLGVALLVAVVLAAAIGGIWFSRSSAQFRMATPFDSAAYSSSANSLRGNTYKLDGEVLALLAWSPSGRLVSVGIEDGEKAVPVLLPSEFNPINIQKGQSLRFLLVVDDQGILRVKKLAKA